MRPIWSTPPILLILATTAAMLAPVTVSGQENSKQPANPDMRFQIERQHDFYIRLDKKTGETSYCRQLIDNLVCTLAVEERNTFHDEIAELQSQLAALQEKLDALSDSSDKDGNADNSDQDNSLPPTPKKDVPDNKSDESSGLDRDMFEQEMDRAIDITRQAMRKLFEAVKELQREFEKEATE